jgi:Late embryogenesis abundant protein
MTVPAKPNSEPIARSSICIALFSALFATLAACANVPRSAAAPRVQLTEMRTLPASAESQRFRVELSMDNLNDFALAVDQLNFTARFGGEGYISGQSQAPFVIDALGTRLLEITVDADRLSSASRLLAVAEGPERLLSYQLDIELIVGGRPPRSLSVTGGGRVALTATLGP